LTKKASDEHLEPFAAHHAMPLRTSALHRS
jgi:hypothetical protein